MIKAKITGLEAALDRIDQASESLVEEMTAEIHAFCVNIQRDAKSMAPADEGLLRNQIQVDARELFGNVSVNSKYAAYMEFGTKGFAAKYVASLPPDWQQMASSFRGGDSGSFQDMVKRIGEWLRRKGSDADPEFIALLIARHGVKQRPYLYPAYIKHYDKFIRNIQNVINSI
jgi:hypothetical protein